MQTPFKGDDMIFELHCHTHHSRGTKIPTEVMMSPGEVVKLAKKAGIDGIAVTDHRVVSGWKEAREEAKKQGLLFIPGQEIDSSDGHIIGLNLNEGVENFLTGEETLERIREQGGFSVAPHPYDIKNDGIKDMFMRADAVEVFNSFVLDRFSNWHALRKARKSGKPMVVGSDVHMPDMMGLSRNIADAHDMEGLFSEIRKGRVGFRTSYVPVGSVVSWSRDRLYHSYDDVLGYIEKNYGQPKRYVSKSLMGVFVGSKTRAWNVLGGIAIGCSAIYSGVKILTY
jgi:predicted metal-dependent phosphoesterase TrpH